MEDIQSTDTGERSTDEDPENNPENTENSILSASSQTVVGSPLPSETVVTHTQSLSAADEIASATASPTSADSSTSAKAKRKTRARKTSIIPSHDRVPRSASRQCPRSEEDTGPCKRARNDNNDSQTKQAKKRDSTPKVPDKATMSYLDNLMSKFTEAIFKKLESTKEENNAKLDVISAEVKAFREELTSRISIVERKTDKLEAEMTEKMLQLENSNITLTTKCDQLHQQLQTTHMYNDMLAKTVDELAQDKRNLNLFTTGLKQESTTKEGFLRFARETLEINAQEDEIRSIFKVNKTGDPIMKIMFVHSTTA